MKKHITIPALRIKITGKCNRSCSFCHEEGDMKNIKAIKPNEKFKQVSSEIMKICNIKRIMFTGGEPTTNKNLQELVETASGISLSESISVTTNGIKLHSKEEWINLKNKGLKKVIFSIHDSSAEDFLSLETRSGLSIEWAKKSYNNQFLNIVNALEAGLLVRTNTVACTTYDKLRIIIERLFIIQKKYPNLNIRILDELNDVVRSQYMINQLLNFFSVTLKKIEKRSGSSSMSRLYRTSHGYYLSVKFSNSYYLNAICNSCSLKTTDCTEGFYGVRLEERDSDYYVRLCIYRNDEKVLMPWKDFIKSKKLINSINNLYE